MMEAEQQRPPPRVLRRAGAGDAAAIAAVLTEARDAQAFLPRLHTADDDYHFVSERMLPANEVWVVEERRVVVGFVSFSGDLLGHLYVAPGAQRRGVGHLLLDTVKQRRPDGFVLWTHQPNAQARAFYEHEGLRSVEFTDGSGNEEKVPDVRYAWRLGSIAMAVYYTGFGIRDLPSLPARRPAATVDHPIAQRFREYGEAGRRAIAEPFVGVTTKGQVVPDLFAPRSTGVSTEPLRAAAVAFLDSLDAGQRARATFGIEDPMWQAWSNIHCFIMRHGVALDDCSETQRQRALDLLKATCSARGFTLARDVMHLNHALGELTGRPAEYGEWYYWLSIFGEPSRDQPWGWQLDGHHLNLNCFVLGDQLVMSPSFFGSEPTAVDSGKYAGTRVFADEEQHGLEFARGLSADQRRLAIPESTEGVLQAQRMDGRIQTAAFRDNFLLPYAGIRANEFSKNGQRDLLDLIEIYIGRMRDGHAEVRMGEIAEHLDHTYFVWVGGLADDSVFYYRIQSPVVSIEFDHLNGIAFDNDEPSRNHIHTMVRTPNGNDYGKDLLRQHLARHHAPATAGAHD